MLSGGVVEAVAPKRKWGMPPGSINTCPRKMAGMAQFDLIINEKITLTKLSLINYVHESLLEDAPKFYMIPENK